jgi:hypothetical protein
MRRAIGSVLGSLAALVLFVPAAHSGEPHFVRCSLVSVSGTCVTVSAKEAGLGDEEQIEVELTATAACINPGGQDPRAANKEDIATAAAIPVQNGRADYTLTGCADFQPACSPPMSVVITDVLLTDMTFGLTCEP